MRRHKTTIAGLMLIAFIGISFLACGPPPPKPEEVEGKWLAIKKENYTYGGGQQVGFTIEFFKDKSVAMPAGKGTWSITDQGQINIELASLKMSGAIKDKLLTITMPDKKGKVIFKKQ
jgi:hypothetical protein